MFSSLFLLFLFVPAAIVASLTLFLLRIRPPEKRARGFPVVVKEKMKSKD